MPNICYGQYFLFYWLTSRIPPKKIMLSYSFLNKVIRLPLRYPMLRRLTINDAKIIIRDTNPELTYPHVKQFDLAYRCPTTANMIRIDNYEKLIDYHTHTLNVVNIMKN